MTKLNDPHDADFRATLPADLQSLDRELSGIRIEERPSFGPELERELARVWGARADAASGASRPWARMLIAACLAGVMIASVSVPSARAAVFEFVKAVAEEVGGFLVADTQPELQLPEVVVQEPAPDVSQPMTGVEVSPRDASAGAETSDAGPPMLPVVEVTFPELISRQDAGDMIASYYPVELQRAGVGGSVKLQFWVDERGTPESIQVREGSGNQRLDYAAMRAARDLRFRPATRNRNPVGTWVEVTLHFFPLSGAGIIGMDSTGPGK